MLLQDSIVCRSPAVVAKECGRTLGIAVQQTFEGRGGRTIMAAIGLWQPTGSLIVSYLTLGLSAGKESGSLITMMGQGVSISPDAFERGMSSRRKSIDEIAGFLNHH
jgi:hypothetical protein